MIRRLVLLVFFSYIISLLTENFRINLWRFGVGFKYNNPMTYRYIYNSKLRDELSRRVEGVDYGIWQRSSLSDLVSGLNKPTIELGGPTQDGFYFLESVEFTTKPIITNISLNPLPFSPHSPELAKQVDEVLDATSMPYADSSVGIFLMSAMSISSDWWVELSDEEKEKAVPVFEAEAVDARLEMGRVATGIQDPKTAEHAQRIKIFCEINRCLEENGLLFTDGGVEEIAILRQMNFELIACLQVVKDDGIGYEFVMVKRS